MNIASQRLPFRPLLPTELPVGYALAQSHVNAFADGTGLIDLVYLAGGKGQIQLFESNYAPTKPMLAPTASTERVTINGKDWDYRLLAFPQPNGSRLHVHALMGTLDGIYVSLAVHSTGDLSGERASLLRVASSLR